MTKRMVLVLALVVMVGVVACGLAADAPKEKPKSNVIANAPLKAEKVKAVKAVALARDLAAYAEEKKSPMLMAACAEILIDNPSSEVDPKNVQAAPATRPAQVELRQPVLDIAKMLADALKLAAENKDVQTFVKKVQDRVPDATRGPVLGPQRAVGIALAGMWVSYSIPFKADETACVYLQAGNPFAILKLYVYDENGNLITSDTENAAIAECKWTPAWTGKFTVKVVNAGLVDTDFAIIMY